MHTDRLLKTTTMKLILLLTLCAPMVQPQGRATPNPEAAANLPAQKIGPRDLIMVQVYGSPELSRSVRVGADGMLRLPMLKQRIKGEGMMPNDLEVMVAQALEEEGLIVDPMVTITVAEYSSRPISVAGAVKEPLTFQASAPVTLLEAITRAGGLTPVAGSEILVSKTQTGPGGQPTSLMQRVSVKALIEGTDPEANLRLSGGEEVRVPEAGKVFVVGNVKRPGAFPVEDGAETSVLRMLARAEGLTPFAGKLAYIYRREASGSKNEIPIEINKIMLRKAPDAPLLANDVLYIPDNRNGRLGLAILEKLLLFGGTAGATALVYGSR
jgi:polysaccharide export outer membrane protein